MSKRVFKRDPTPINWKREAERAHTLTKYDGLFGCTCGFVMPETMNRQDADIRFKMHRSAVMEELEQRTEQAKHGHDWDASTFTP